MDHSSTSFWDIDGNGKFDFDEGLFWFGIAGGIAEEIAQDDYEEHRRHFEKSDQQSSYYINNENEYDDCDDDDDPNDRYDICDVDWDDHRAVMRAIRSGKYYTSDLESMLDNITGLDFKFTEAEYEEICGIIHDERVKSHLFWFCMEDSGD